MGKSDFLGRLSRFGRWCLDFGHVLISAFRGMGKDNITIVASGMVYSTLIAFVPCLTFLFSSLSALGVADSLLNLIGEWLIATFGQSTGGDLTSYLSAFSQNAMSLGIAGLFSFVFTAMLLVNKIYTTLNQIFHTRPTSGAVKRFSTFLTFILVTCFLIGVALLISRRITNIAKRIAIGAPVFKGGTRFLKSFGYSLVGWGVLFLLYKFVPRAKIKAASAVAGSVVCVIALWCASKVFGEITSRMVNYSVIYGSLASLFIALLFLYVAWYIILFCAELVYVHQFRPERSVLLGHPEPPSAQISVAVNMILLISNRYKKGRGAMTLKELMSKLGVPSVTLNSYLSDFEDAKIIMSVNTTRSAYIPAKPLDQILLVDIVYTVYGSSLMAPDAVDTIGEAVALDFLNKGLEGIERMTVEDLLERI